MDKEIEGLGNFDTLDVEKELTPGIKERGTKKKVLYWTVGFAFVAGFLISFITSGYIADRKIDKIREAYQGTLLPIEEGRAYRAVIVLTYPISRGEGTMWRFVGDPEMQTVGGKPIEAGKTYIMEQGLRLVAEVKVPSTRSKK